MAPTIEMPPAPADAPAEPRRNHAMTAALIGGAAAAAAGAVWGARRLARRPDGDGTDGKPLNAVMKTALTATEMGPGRTSVEPSVPSEPPVPPTPAPR